jgi:hypothetical protein
MRYNGKRKGHGLLLGHKIVLDPNDRQMTDKPNFIRAVEIFDDLVNRGLIKKRGYTLLPIEEHHRPRYRNAYPDADDYFACEAKRRRRCAILEAP